MEMKGWDGKSIGWIESQRQGGGGLIQGNKNFNNRIYVKTEAEIMLWEILSVILKEKLRSTRMPTTTTTTNQG